MDFKKLKYLKYSSGTILGVPKLTIQDLFRGDPIKYYEFVIPEASTKITECRELCLQNYRRFTIGRNICPDLYRDMFYKPYYRKQHFIYYEYIDLSPSFRKQLEIYRELIPQHIPINEINSNPKILLLL